ncbi:MAG: hypothetical protein M3256_07290 [Actinomycetota bacterium]|nr:hypothetical protein [Actinomycetota bacterium]
MAAPLVAHFDDVVVVSAARAGPDHGGADASQRLFLLSRPTATASPNRDRAAGEQWTRTLRSTGFMLGRARRDGPRALGRFASRYRRS